jgi:hypothetical protein
VDGDLMEREELILLGKIDGKIDGISDHLKAQDQRLDAIDERLRVVEQKAAVTGAISGGAISVGMAIIIEGVRQALRIKGG